MFLTIYYIFITDTSMGKLKSKKMFNLVLCGAFFLIKIVPNSVAEDFKFRAIAL